MGKVEAPKKKGKDRTVRRLTERWLWDEIRHEVLPLSLGSMAMVISSYSNQASKAVPRLLGRLMDPVPAKPESKGFSSLTSSILCLGLVGGTASFVRTVSLNHVQDSLAGRMRKQAFRILLTKRDLEWFRMATAGNMSEKEEVGTFGKGRKQKHDESYDTPPAMTPAEISVVLKDDVDLVARTVTGSLANLLRSFGSCIFGTYNMLCLNPSLLGLSLAVAPVVGTLAWFTRKYLKAMLALQNQASLEAASFLDEKLHHIMMVKMSNREEDEINKYNAIQDRYISGGKRSAVANGLSMGSMFFLSVGALCGILLRGGKAVESKRMTHGELVSFGSYSFLLALGSAGIVKSFSDLMKGMVSADRLYLIIFSSTCGGDNGFIDSTVLGSTIDASSGARGDRKDETKEGATLQLGGSFDNIPLHGSGIQEISTKHLCFSYGTSSLGAVLRDVSIKVSLGEALFLVGQNGSGKSSLCALLAGLYTDYAGDIVVRSKRDGDATLSEINYRDIDRKTFPQLVQVVPQDPAIFDTTILENVRYSCPLASNESVRQALEAANCDGFIAKLEGGINYRVGRNGSRLSGGQRQRLGLARALLSDPVLLILDEPASSLDAEGESAVSAAVDTCRSCGKALLLVTHNAKTLSLADRILVLQDGNIVQDGTLSALQAQENSLLMKLMPGL